MGIATTVGGLRKSTGGLPSARTLIGFVGDDGNRPVYGG
jgi:hypothetical protein